MVDAVTIFERKERNEGDVRVVDEEERWRFVVLVEVSERGEEERGGWRIEIRVA